MRKLLFAVIAACVGLTGCATAQTRQEMTLQGANGNLAAVLQAPDNHPKTYPLVIILHGFNANKEMYLLTELAEQLRARGIGTLMFDFNGHGASDGSFLDMTVLNELEDARKVYAYASKLPQVSSVSMVGHSMGGVVTSMLAAELGEQKIKAIALMAPAGELPEDTSKGDLFGVRYDPKNVPEYITLGNGLKVGRAFLETTQTLPIYETSAHYTGPVLIVHSQDDQLVPYQYGVRFLNIYKNAHLETLHGINHNATQHEAEVDKIVADFFVEQLIGEKHN